MSNLNNFFTDVDRIDHERLYARYFLDGKKTFSKTAYKGTCKWAHVSKKSKMLECPELDMSFNLSELRKVCSYAYVYFISPTEYLDITLINYYEKNYTVQPCTIEW